jgi:hypothetical protein
MVSSERVNVVKHQMSNIVAKTPNEQYRGKNTKWAISWQKHQMSSIMAKTPNEQYHDKNTKWAISWQKHQMSNIMAKTPNEQYHGKNTKWAISWQKHQMSNIVAKTSYIRWDDYDVLFVLYQHSYFDFYSVSPEKQQSTGRHVGPLWHIILILNQLVFDLTP